MDFLRKDGPEINFQVWELCNGFVSDSVTIDNLPGFSILDGKYFPPNVRRPCSIAFFLFF